MGKRLVVLLVAACVGAGLYLYSQADASAKVKRMTLSAVEQMELSANDAAYVRGLIGSAHKAAFDKAMNSVNKAGRKFDSAAYYTEVQRHVLDSARNAGRGELADHLAIEFAQFTFDAGER